MLRNTIGDSTRAQPRTPEVNTYVVPFVPIWNARLKRVSREMFIPYIKSPKTFQQFHTYDFLLNILMFAQNVSNHFQHTCPALAPKHLKKNKKPLAP